MLQAVSVSSHIIGVNPTTSGGDIIFLATEKGGEQE